MRKVLIAIVAVSLGGTLMAATATPETVMITYRPKAGSEKALARVIAEHWAAAKRLDLVRPEPHITLSATDKDGVYFVDIFTWRDASIPDAAPAEIKTIWDEMNQLTEARGGHPAMALTEMTVLTSPGTFPGSFGK